MILANSGRRGDCRILALRLAYLKSILKLNFLLERKNKGKNVLTRQVCLCRMFLSNEEMIKCLQKKANKEEIPYKCKKLTWFDKNTNKISFTVSLSALAISLFCIYSIQKN